MPVAAAEYHVVPPDWRGYGLSDQPPEADAEAASYDDPQQDLLALLDALSVPKVVYPALGSRTFLGKLVCPYPGISSVLGIKNSWLVLVS
jgi:hypothetical protein